MLILEGFILGLFGAECLEGVSTRSCSLQGDSAEGDRLCVIMSVLGGNCDILAGSGKVLKTDIQIF